MVCFLLGSRVASVREAAELNLLALRGTRYILSTGEHADVWLVDPLERDHCSLYSDRIQNALTELNRSFKTGSAGTNSNSLPGWWARFALLACDQDAQRQVASVPLPPNLRPDTQALLGTVQWQLGDEEGAAQMWRSSGYDVYFAGLAAWAYERQDWQAARNYAELAVSLNPQDAEALVTLGLAGMKTGMPGERIVAVLERASPLEPSDWRPQQALTNYYMYFSQPRDYHAALLQMEEARRRGYPRESYHFNRGYMFYNIHRYEDALAELVAAYQASPKPNKEILRMYGLTLLKLGRATEAVSILQELVIGFPMYPHYRLDLARAYVAVGDIAASGLECQAVLAACPQCEVDKSLFEGLGMVEACRP